MEDRAVTMPALKETAAALCLGTCDRCGGDLAEGGLAFCGCDEVYCSVDCALEARKRAEWWEKYHDYGQEVI